MDILPHCPICDQPAVSEAVHERAGVTTGNYLCLNEHIWLTRWNAEVA